MRPAHDLSNLIKWLSREDSRPLLEEVMAEHFGPSRTPSTWSSRTSTKRSAATGARRCGLCFEDFSPDASSRTGEIRETYLKRRGWRSRAAARRYMTALQTSVMSLYKVSDLIPGQSLRARDLIQGGGRCW